MKKCLLMLVMLLVSAVSFSQVYDNFEDGDFTYNPLWDGHQDRFEINSNFQLRLNHPGETNTAYLNTINQIMDSVSWSFFIKLSFSPSANNNARVYLASNQANLEENLQGYYLQFGEAGSSDAIELFKQNGDEHISICRGEEERIASSFSVSVKVVHKQDDWIVYTDFDDTGSYTIECQGNDGSAYISNYFGFSCKYTSSNSTKFYFDDIDIKYVEIDQMPPSVESVSVMEHQKLKISFSEAVTKETAENTYNYRVDFGIEKPNNATLNTSQKEVILDFQNVFEEDKEYSIHISSVKDLVNNMMNDTTIVFKRTELKAYDVIITEIMADPTPEVHLPNAEYLEVYNRTGNGIDLSDWILQIGNSEKIFPETIIPSDGYLILCKSNNIGLLSPYGTCLGFSSFSLVNSGAQLVLKNKDDAIIHEVAYTEAWYQDDEKADGGWSLELIDPSAYCQEEGNWRESVDENGGSPGSINSIDGSIDEPLDVIIKRMQIIDNRHIRLVFSGKMDSLFYGDPLFYNIDNGLGHPVESFMEAPKYNSIILSLSKNLEYGLVYTIETLEGI
ncbi:MAG: lamin tail domain-containing protein, partial [Bacteroidales bacterium]|nr:lamin tail domain-containing protein [Bacteroidales bacterium]